MLWQIGAHSGLWYHTPLTESFWWDLWKVLIRGGEDSWPLDCSWIQSEQRLPEDSEQIGRVKEPARMKPENEIPGVGELWEFDALFKKVQLLSKGSLYSLCPSNMKRMWRAFSMYPVWAQPVTGLLTNRQNASIQGMEGLISFPAGLRWPVD